MKAALFTGVGDPLQIAEQPDPVPDAEGVVIKVQRCGICASDLHYTDGHSALGAAPNSVLGHEVSGEIVAIGGRVSRVKVGDRVAAMCLSGCGLCDSCRSGRPLACERGARMLGGGYAEYCLSGENGVIRLPESLSPADGALVEPLAVALRSVLRCRIPMGAHVLVLGAGPIGLSATFWCRQMGAGTIAVGELNRDREELASIMGADHFLVAAETDRSLAALCRETLGRLPDVVIDCVGAPGMLKLAIECVRPGGTIGVVGFCMVPDSFIPSQANAKEASIVFSAVYNLDEYEYVARTLDRGLVQPRAMLNKTIGLSELPEMFEHLRGRTALTKVHVNPWMN